MSEKERGEAANLRSHAITLSDISSSSSRILTVQSISIISHYTATNSWSKSIRSACVWITVDCSRARVKIRLFNRKRDGVSRREREEI